MNRKEAIQAELGKVREKTLWLFDQVPDEFLRKRVHSFYSPIGWHFGHIARTEEYWVLCEALDKDSIDEKLSFVYADRPDNPKDNRVNILDRPETIDYLSKTRTAVLEALDEANLTVENPYLVDGYAWEFALQHECQHQETILEMLCLIHQEIGGATVEPLAWANELKADFIDLPAGEFIMGSDDLHVYDNEKKSHLASVGAFKLARTAVSAFQWTVFIDDGGYSRQELWTDEGWAWKLSEDATMPEYWVQLPGGGWATYGPLGLRAIDPNEPAASISHFEAAAYAKWAGKRLPTEAEWEYSRQVPVEGFDVSAIVNRELKPASVFDMSHDGLHHLPGNVWEHTSSQFLPYDGFMAFPYDGYSKDHMKGEHFVVRGGSWATAAPILRPTFRNWYVPTYRQGFLGMRLAE